MPPSTYSHASAKHPKTTELPSPTLLPSLTKSHRPLPPLPPSPYSQYLTHSAYSLSSSTPLPLRPSTSPAIPLTPGLFHPSRLTPPPTAPTPSKPRWFTNRLALSLPPSSSHLDFARYQSHDSASPYNPNRKHWTREQMLEEIYAEHRAAKAKLRNQRVRLDQELARKDVARALRKHRRALLQWLQGEGCHLFDGTASIVTCQDAELDLLIQIGGVEDVKGGKGKSPAFLVNLEKLNQAGVTFLTFPALVEALKQTREKAETLTEPPQDPLPQVEVTEVQVEPTAEAAPVVHPVEVVEVKATVEEVVVPVVEAEVVAVVPQVVESSEEGKVSEDKGEEGGGGEAEDKVEALGEGTDFVEPSESRARMDSVIAMNEEGHVRNNTAAEAEKEEVAPAAVEEPQTAKQAADNKEEVPVAAVEATAEAVTEAVAAPGETAQADETGEWGNSGEEEEAV